MRETINIFNSKTYTLFEIDLKTSKKTIDNYLSDIKEIFSNYGFDQNKYNDLIIKCGIFLEDKEIQNDLLEESIENEIREFLINNMQTYTSLEKREEYDDNKGLIESFYDGKDRLNTELIPVIYIISELQRKGYSIFEKKFFDVVVDHFAAVSDLEVGISDE